MDPLSIIASVVSVGGVVVASAQGLYDLVQSIRNAPEELTHILEDTHIFYTIINNLQTALKESFVVDAIKDDDAMVTRVSILEEPLRRSSALLGQLLQKIRRHLRSAEDGRVMRFKSLDWKWYFTRKEILEVTDRLAVTRGNVNTALESITMLCTFRLLDAGVHIQKSVGLNSQYDDNDAGSALREYVKKSSIASSLPPPIERLHISTGESQDLPKPQNRALPASMEISSETERVRKADNQRTALHNAARSGEELNIIELVIEEGANVNAIDANGMTALHFAAMHGKENAALALLRHGANVHARTIPPRGDPGNLERKILGGRTPLHWAAAEGYDVVVQILLDHHADPGAKNTSGRSPLLEATQNAHELVARALIERGAPVNDSNDEDWTPLHQACTDTYLKVDWSKPQVVVEFFYHFTGDGVKRRANIARLMLDHGADMETLEAKGHTPFLVSSLQNTTVEISALLIERGADIRAYNKNRGLAIHEAAIRGNTALIELLLDAGLEVDILDQEWSETALHKAASQNHLQTTRLLLERGADPRAVQKNGRDVLTHTRRCLQNPNPEIIRLIEEHLGIPQQPGWIREAHKIAF